MESPSSAWLDESTLKQRARAVFAGFEKKSDLAFAKYFIGQCSDAEIFDLAVAYLEDWAWEFKRSQQKRVERIATQVPDSHVENSNSLADSFSLVFEDPSIWYGKSRRPPVGVVYPSYNAKTRNAFQKWCGARFEEWHVRTLRLVKNSVYEESFNADWYPGGVKAYFDGKLEAELFSLMAEYRKEIRLEVTEELLTSMFALGDGRRVSWGQATIKDHQERVALLMRNSLGNLEAAARHEAAIVLIKEKRVEKLADL